MNLHINFKNYIRQYLAPHKRTPLRLCWLTGLLHLQKVFDDFSAWRHEYRYKVKVTSQSGVLRAHLKKVFKTDILILSFKDGNVAIGNNEEQSHWKSLGKNDENQFIAFPLQGENIISFDDSDFIVIAPASVDINQLRSEIDKYKLADKTYNIKKEII